MKTLIVNSQWINGDLRIDSKYHLSDGRLTKLKIKKSPFQVEILANVSLSIYNGPRFKRYYVNDAQQGIPFMGSSDMLKTNFFDLKYISKKLSKNLAELYVKKDWILVSCSGTIGNTVYTNSDFEGKTASQHIMRIIPDPNKIKSGFLYAYLSSKYGYSLLTQGTYGAVIQHIEPHHLNELPVPVFPDSVQEEVSKLITDAASLRVKANKLLEECLSTIDTSFVFEKPQNIYTVNIKEIKSGDKFTNESRFESDYYQPSTNKVIEQIKGTTYALLGDLCHSVSISNLRGRIFVKNGFTLFTGQSLGLLKPDMSKQLSRKLTKNIAENTTLDGDILVSAFGTLGKTEFCYKNFHTGVFASQQLVRIRTDREKVHPGYLYLFLKSKAGQLLIQKYKTGSVIEWANWNNFSSIPVTIPVDQGAALGTYAEKIAVTSQLAYEKEQQAIKIIENEIESWQD